MVSTLNSGSKGFGSSPGRVVVLCCWARNFTLTVPLPTQEYKWVPANCQEKPEEMLGGYPVGVAVLLVASCYGIRDKLRQ